MSKLRCRSDDSYIFKMIRSRVCALCFVAALSTCGSCAVATQPGGELVQAVAIFRHGADSPLDAKSLSIWVDPWDVCGGRKDDLMSLKVITPDGNPVGANADDAAEKNMTHPERCTKGELTTLGYTQARAFGRWLSSRYGLNPTAIKAFSTNYGRTLRTLRGVLTELFPMAKDSAVTISGPSLRSLLYDSRPTCKRLELRVDELSVMQKGKFQWHVRMAGNHRPARFSKEHRLVGVHLVNTPGMYLHADQFSKRPKFHTLNAQLRNALNLTSDDDIDYYEVYDIMYTIVVHGKLLPIELRDPAILGDVHTLALEGLMDLLAPSQDVDPSKEVLQLGIGRLLYDIVQSLREAGTQDGAPKMVMYSAHASTIMSVLAALEIPVTEWPPFLSSIVFELWQEPTGHQYVKVLHDRAEVSLMKLCGTDTCELDTLSKSWTSLLLDQATYELKCKAS